MGVVDDEFMTLDTLPRDHYDGRISFCFFSSNYYPSDGI